jgi:YgiT-type zinc finger domain-containing protein
VTERYEYEGDGETRIVIAENVPVKVCEVCGETLSGLKAACIHREAIARTFGLLAGEEVRSFREELGKSLSEFATMTGIPEDDLSNWERSRTLQDRALDRYLRLLINNPENVKLLEQFQAKAAATAPPLANGPVCEGNSAAVTEALTSAAGTESSR